MRVRSRKGQERHYQIVACERQIELKIMLAGMKELGIPADPLLLTALEERFGGEVCWALFQEGLTALKRRDAELAAAWEERWGRHLRRFKKPEPPKPPARDERLACKLEELKEKGEVEVADFGELMQLLELEG